MTDLTIVTGIWDLGRDGAGQGFARTFDHYRAKFGQLLATDIPMVVFGDAALEPFVREMRSAHATDFRIRPASHFREGFDFYRQVQQIRRNPAWLAQVGWLRESPQASMELYNPMVMSKMFMLHDASLWNPFVTQHFAWIDGGITNTVHPGYFTHDRVLNRVDSLLQKFFFVSFPYEGGQEIHGFDRAAMRNFGGFDPKFVCRGGFFGGQIDCISEVNEHYYSLLSSTLHEGHMGTEESIFTLMAYEEPGLYDRYELRAEDCGLLGPFFDYVKTLPLATPARSVADGTQRRVRIPDVSARTMAGYVVTFNAPQQLDAVLASWTTQFHFDQLYVLDQSTDEEARRENCAIIGRYNAELLTHPNGNGGVCGARQFVAEHFDRAAYDYCVYIEDDMFLNAPEREGVCRNGFRLGVRNLRDVVVRIMVREKFDFLKLSFTEFYGDNTTQFSWYNVPQTFRQGRWPEKPHLPAQGLDPDAPRTVFGNIGTVDGVAYADGEVYYCNWPHVVSRDGNHRMFLDTVWEHPFEQTWMSHMYQLTLKGQLHPAVLLASVVTHNRTQHYPAEQRREN